jgi:hypothetical protein
MPEERAKLKREFLGKAAHIMLTEIAPDLTCHPT